MNEIETLKDPENVSSNDVKEIPNTHESITSKEDVNDKQPELSEENKWEDILGSGGLLKQVLVEGKPDTRPQRMQICRIKYTCTLDDETIVESKDDFELILGDSEIIQGLDLALGLMNVGEVSKLKIEGRLAYGSKGLDTIVPPDASVNYEVHLLSSEPEEDMETLTINQRRIRGNKKRELGNWWYGREENQIAIRCYRRALDYLDEVEGGITKPTEDGEPEVTDAALQQLLEDRINVSNNMAAAQLKLELYDAALQSLQTVLRCQPDNVKALFRKAKVHRAKNDISSALKSLRKALKVAPDNTDLIKEITGLQKLQDKQKNSERELARRMFNGLQNDSKNKTQKSSFKLFLWSTMGASVVVGLLGLAAYRFKFA